MSVYQERSSKVSKLQIKFEKSELSSYELKENFLRVLRLIDGGRHISLKGSWQSDSQEMEKKAESYAKYGQEIDYDFLPAQDFSPAAGKDTSFLMGLEKDDLRDMGEHLIDAVIKQFPKLSVDLSVSRTLCENHLKNSLDLLKNYLH